MEDSQKDSDILYRPRGDNIKQNEDLQGVIGTADVRSRHNNQTEIAEIKGRKQRIWEEICVIFADGISRLSARQERPETLHFTSLHFA